MHLAQRLRFPLLKAKHYSSFTKDSSSFLSILELLYASITTLSWDPLLAPYVRLTYLTLNHLIMNSRVSSVLITEIKNPPSKGVKGIFIKAWKGTSQLAY